MEILPSECWLLIFRHLTKISDIISNSLVCKDFHSLMNKAVEIIDDNKSFYVINYNLLDKWSNLHTVKLKMSYFTTLSYRSLMPIKTLTLSREFHLWTEYWLDNCRTQEEFVSISHKIKYLSHSGVMEWFICHKGTIYDPEIQSVYIRDVIIKLTEKYFVKFSVTNNAYHLNTIAMRLRHFDIAIKLISSTQTPNFNPFYFIWQFHNITYIEMDPEELFTCMQSSDMYSFLDDSPIVNRKIDIKIPIYSDCVDLFLIKFPEVKSIIVIIPDNNKVPQIPGVQIKGYDRFQECYI